MSKIYALYFNEDTHEMKISCESHWEDERKKLEESDESIIKFNNFYFLSFSRMLLVHRAREIRNYWLSKQYETIKKIANIDIK